MSYLWDWAAMSRFETLGETWNQTVMDYQTLKTRQRLERVLHPPNLALRVHRALSWLNRAEQVAEDRDGQFIFLWIAFNAAYATDLDDRRNMSMNLRHERRSI